MRLKLFFKSKVPKKKEFEINFFSNFNKKSVQLQLQTDQMTLEKYISEINKMF